MIFGRFLIDLGPHREAQNHWKTNGFLRFLLFLLDRSWDRFWTDFWSILDPQIVPKSLPRSSLKLLKIIAVFGCLLEPQKIDFCVNMAATWSDLGPQDGPNLGPKWCQNRSRRHMGPHGAPMDPYGAPPNRFWIDFGMILGRFWVDFGSILNRFFGWVFVACLLHSDTMSTYGPSACGYYVPLPSAPCCCMQGAGGRGGRP